LTLLQADVEVLVRAIRPAPATGHTGAQAIPDNEGNEEKEAFLMLPQEDGEIIAEMAEEIGHMKRLLADLLTLAQNAYASASSTSSSLLSTLESLLTAKAA